MALAIIAKIGAASAGISAFAAYGSYIGSVVDVSMQDKKIVLNRVVRARKEGAENRRTEKGSGSMKKNIIENKFDVMDEFTQMYVRTAFVTALELTGCVECARDDVIKRVQKMAEQKSLEVSLLYGSEWDEDDDTATSPEGISSYCSTCRPSQHS